MLLGCSRGLECLIAKDAHMAQMNLLRQVVLQTFQVNQTVDIEDEEIVGLAHVVEALLDSIFGFVAEETRSGVFEGCQRS